MEQESDQTTLSDIDYRLRQIEKGILVEVKEEVSLLRKEAKNISLLILVIAGLLVYYLSH
jgi:hypothetical protein